MKHLLLGLLLFCSVAAKAQQPHYFLLKADRVFDGSLIHKDWAVLVKDNRIEKTGPVKEIAVPEGADVLDFPGGTILPGLIEGHSHLFLHPYNETNWENQVLKESRAERTARAVNHARSTLQAGFTTVRDLGTEGAMYDDVGLKAAIEKGVVPGPRMIVATRAIVAKGTYGPRAESAEVDFPQGAAEVGNAEEAVAEVRTQISKGADLIKIYADYGWGKDKKQQPTFTGAEIMAMVAIAQSSNRQVVAHASTPEGMRRAVHGGVSTIEHGDEGTREIFRLMKKKGVALCPTLAAGTATERYKGWRKGIDSDSPRILRKKESFRLALESGVTICMGGDAGVYSHGTNAIEMELLVEYGMKPLEVLRSATSVNARVFGYAEKIGSINPGLLADLIVVQGDPSQDIKAIRDVKMVMKDGVIVLPAASTR